MNEFEKCVQDGRLVKMSATDDIIGKELEEAEYDLVKAEESLMKEDYKWASVQAYYSMFHSAKALVFRKGYREKSHYCLIVALRELYVNTNELDGDYVDTYEMCMDIRHEADYGLSYDKESARLCIEAAGSFLQKTKDLPY